MVEKNEDRGGIARQVRMISYISARWVTRPDGESDYGYIVFFRFQMKAVFWM